MYIQSIAYLERVDEVGHDWSSGGVLEGIEVEDEELKQNQHQTN
jgi:hypothetical protein